MKLLRIPACVFFSSRRNADCRVRAVLEGGINATAVEENGGACKALSALEAAAGLDVYLPVD